jgi:resuscitation-promoting factor RpfB
VSGTRSNPHHGDAYEPQGSYAGAGGTSEAAEYYYEDQYSQQQHNQFSQYEQYAGSSAQQYEQPAFQPQQGLEPGYGEAGSYQDGYGGPQGGYDRGSQDQQGYYPENGQYAQAEYVQVEQYTEYVEYAAETDGYSSGHGQGEYAGGGEQYAAAGYPDGGGYQNGYGELSYAPAEDGYPAGYPDTSAEPYDGPGGRGGAPLFGAAASFAAAGSATAMAAEAFEHGAFEPRAGGVGTLVADPESTATIAAVPVEAPETPAPETAPAPRRGRSERTRPETKANGAGKPPTVLRTRPRTGPLGRIVQGTVLAALVAGAVTYVAFDKSITLNIDGQTQTLHTFAGTVGAVLTADDISTGSKDIVTPAPGSSASDDETIMVHYGRPLSLDVNGVTEKTWVHYPTVQQALQELGVRTTGAKSSDAMGTTIPRAGLTGLVVYTMRHVTFLVDGKTMQLNTTAATVTQAIAQAGIVLHNQDSASVPASSVPTNGETISINRVTGTTETKEVSIPFQTTQVSNPNAYTGTSSVTTEGVDGEETITYAVLVVNGVKQSPKQVSEAVTRKPVNEVVSTGTEALPTSASDLDWSALANCESGGNPAEDTGNGFYGMYQFTVSTWDSLGGSGLPSDASAGTQTALAEKLYSEAGAGQWPVCGKNLFS